MYLAAVPIKLYLQQIINLLLVFSKILCLELLDLLEKILNFDIRTAMNLLMYFDNVNPELFKNPKKKLVILNFKSKILPPLSTRMKNGVLW